MKRLLLLLPLFISWGCPSSVNKSSIKKVGPSERSESLSVKDYFPLRVGHTWIYQISYGKGVRQKVEKIKIVKRKGNTFYDNTSAFFTYTPQGVRANEVRYLLKYPLKVGNRWLSVTGITDIERYEIISVNSEVSVPAGTFKNCIVVRSKKRINPKLTLVAEHVYAPKVGLVKLSTFLVSPGKRLPQFTLQLQRFIPAPAPSSSHNK